ncbi:putative Tc1-like transposase DDE domain-containing protein [Seiridium unicorne]|uniref:Tc1-like transposase DDE domain-containing protein n=1 Tax=Seiridium unicorne TaxID=138068 RepID=A0ABR2V5B1_9PEZI
MVASKGDTHFDTPRRAKLRGVWDFLLHHDLLGKKKGQMTIKAVCEYFEISRRAAYEIKRDRTVPMGALPPELEESPAFQNCSDPNSRTLNNDPRALLLDHRRPREVFTKADAAAVDRYLLQLPTDILYKEKEVSKNTITRRMSIYRWHSIRKELRMGNTEREQQLRFERAQYEIENGRWFNPDWREQMVAADEWHFGFQTITNIPPPKQRKIDLPAEPQPSKSPSPEPRTRAQKRAKPQPQTINFPVTIAPAVKTRFTKKGKDPRWVTHPKDLLLAFTDLEEVYGNRFILWEDRDGAHNTPAVKSFKKERGYLDNYITNAPKCPKTNPIEDRTIANVVKGNTKRSPHCDILMLKELAEEGLFKKIRDDKLRKVYNNIPNKWLQIRDNSGKRINR